MIQLEDADHSVPVTVQVAVMSRPYGRVWILGRNIGNAGAAVVCAWSAGSTGAAGWAAPEVATGQVGQVDFFTGAARSAMPSVATRLSEVGFVTGAARLAMPSVATRLIGVVDVCCLHTLHVSLRSAVVPSASIRLPLRNVCLPQLVDVLPSARKWWVKQSLHTPHVPLRPATDLSASICVPLRNVCLLL